MRFERSEQLLLLAIRMQSAPEGIGLKDIQQHCEVGRRTAERMRDSLLSLFPAAEEIRTDDRTKRWRLPKNTINNLVHFTVDELSALSLAAAHLEQHNLVPHSRLLRQLSCKLDGLLRPDVASRSAADIEAILEAEGHACRVGPRPQLDAGILSTLRESIKACRKVHIRYRARYGGMVSERTISPYGFIYGSRHYLLARCDKAQDLRTFSLPNIDTVRLLEDSYHIPEEFSLQQHIARRFGVFNEDPMTVTLRLSAQVADDVLEHLFHPSQKIEKLDDGRVKVTFTAGGWREICWHLFTWEGHAEILAPNNLRKRFHHMVTTLAGGEAIPRFADPLMDDERYEQLVMEL